MSAATILVVDDEQLIRWSLRSALTKRGYDVLEAATAADGLRLATEKEPDLIVLDQLLPDGTGIDILDALNDPSAVAAGGPPPVVMLTAIDKSEIAVQAMKLGAFDYVTKPVDHEELAVVIEKALEATRLKRQVAHFLREQEMRFGFSGMIGSSPAMERTFAVIGKIARSSSTTVLITGESGTGKELAARALHFLSDRREQPLMTVNCSALTETLVESELFGHERGAFTDAHAQKRGIFELASGGTIFLDEIGDLSQKLQVKLLRVLEQKTFQRVGGTREISVDVRIIAATNVGLEQAVERGDFRSDLYYRLNVARVDMPPVRARGNDILLIAEFFLTEFNTKFHKHFKALTPEAREMFLRYPWPGNVREIRNVLERAVLLADGELLGLADLHFPAPSQSPGADSAPPVPAEDADLPLEELERRAVERALEKAGHNQSQAAKLLKISRDALRYRMKKFGFL